MLSIGERVSARIVARTLRGIGVPATPVDAFDLGFVVELEGETVTPRAESSAAVRAALTGFPGVPVVTGFLAATRSGLVTTLGPNGSDWTAAWLAEALAARELVFWKAVPGVMTADPRLVPEARVVERISWDDAAALAASGAELLHARSVEPARRAGVRVFLRDVTSPQSPGTRFVEECASAAPVALLAAALDEHTARVTWIGGGIEPARVERALASRGRTLRVAEDGALHVARAELAAVLSALHSELFARPALAREHRG